MKAAIFKGVNVISIEDIEVPSLPENGILLKIRAAGICGTDVRIFRGRKNYNYTRGIFSYSVFYKKLL